MRVLLDENVPVALASELTGHEVETVSSLGWTGVTNSELLRRASERFDALITMDQNLPFQQGTASRLGVILIRARSNRLVHIRPLVPAILAALAGLGPGEVLRVGS